MGDIVFKVQFIGSMKNSHRSSFLHPPKYMELYKSKIVSRTLYSKKAVVIVLSYNEEQGNLYTWSMSRTSDKRYLLKSELAYSEIFLFQTNNSSSLTFSSDIGIHPSAPKKPIIMKRVRIKRNRIAMYKHNLRIAMDLHFYFQICRHKGKWKN